MTLAQERLGEIVKWIRLSSRGRTTPLGGGTIVGPFAVIVPSDLDAAPMGGFSMHALPLFVPRSQCEGVETGPIDFEAPASQDRMKARLMQIAWKAEAGFFPACRIIGLPDGRETLADAIERAGAADTDLDAVPLLCAPLWALTAWDRVTIETKLAAMA